MEGNNRMARCDAGSRLPFVQHGLVAAMAELNKENKKKTEDKTQNIMEKSAKNGSHECR